MAKLKKLLIQLICLLTIAGCSQNIIDFSYSEYIQDSRSTKKHADLNIKPQSDSYKYEFPEICNAFQKLQTDLIGDKNEQEKDFDSFIDGLKIKFVQMLKLAEKIKNKKENIRELGQIGFKNINSSLIIPPQKIQLIKNYEKKLNSINDEIKDKTEQLQSLVYELTKDLRDSPLAHTALDFQIESLRFKLKYLKNIASGLSDQSSRKQSELQFKKYFGDIQENFKKDSQLIEDLNRILANYNQLRVLKAKLLTLKNKIEISKVMIEQKEGCAKELAEIRKNQKNQKQIKTLMNNLREKKRDQNINNKYCQGVTTKLKNRLRNVLLSYDITFECADGLDKLKTQMQQDLQTQRDLENRIHQMQSISGIEDYKNNFDKNRHSIKEKTKLINSIKFPEYKHDKSKIQELIYQTQNDLDIALKKKNSIGKNEHKTNQIDFERARKLVNDIKALKGRYCFEHERYDIQVRELWSKIYEYQAQMEYQSKIDSINRGEIDEMRNLQISLEQMKNQLLYKIK